MRKMSAEYIDIHNYNEKYDKTIDYLKRSKISKRNKKLIKEFDNTLSLIDQVSVSRRIRVIGYLINIAKRYMEKDFDKAQKEDIKKAVKIINDRKDYSVWTKQGYRMIIKKFYRWLAHGDEYNNPENKHNYPKKVSWISCTIKADRIPKVTAEDVLTENEITRLLETEADDVKNEAILAVLYESGCRIGEHGSVRIRHVKKDGNCYTITVKGKTGVRETFIVKLAHLLTEWLNIHPYKNDPEAPLWVKHNSEKPMMYHSFVSIVKRAAKKAGIKKRIYPHIFRHSRATHAIVHGEFTSDGAKKIFGWCPDSKMLETYLHLTSADVKDKYLSTLGLGKKQEKSTLNPKICPNCHHPNLFNASICENCRALLDADIGIEKDQRMLSMRKFLSILSEDKYIKFRIEEMAKENSNFMKIVEDLGKEKNT